MCLLSFYVEKCPEQLNGRFIIIICNIQAVLQLPQKPAFILLLLPNHAFIFSNSKHSVWLMLRPPVMVLVKSKAERKQSQVLAWV